MSISNSDIQKALRIKRSVNEHFETSNQSKVLAKDLMSLFITKDIFTKDNQEGLPIRDFLRHLYKNNHLHLIPQVHFEQNEQNINWYFIKTKNN